MTEKCIIEQQLIKVDTSPGLLYKEYTYANYDTCNQKIISEYSVKDFNIAFTGFFILFIIFCILFLMYLDDKKRK